jgi:PAS domain S-box-containing protein
MNHHDMAEKDSLLKAMHDISQTILSTMDMEYIQDMLAEKIVQTGIFRSLMLAVVDEKENSIRVVKSMVRRPGGEIVDRSENIANPTYDLDSDRLLADVVRGGVMEIIEGWDDRFDPHQCRREQFQDRLSYFIPVSLRGQVRAVVATGSKISERPEVEKRIELIQPLLNYLAIALDHADQFWKAQEYSLQLAAMNTRFEREIIERQRAEKEVQTALSLARAILESTADGLLVLDTAGKQVLDYNQKFIEMWKIPEQLMASRDDDRVYEHILSQLTDPGAFKRKVRATNEDSNAESSDVILFKDGRVFERYMRPQRVEGQIVGRVWSFHDITIRVRAEEDRDRYFNRSLDMQCIAGFDGYFKRLNPVWSRVLGYSLDELLTRPSVEFVHPEDQERTIEETKKLAGGSELIAFENRYICKDGAYRWLSWNATIDVDRALIYATARDITEQKWIATALRDSEAQYRDLFENASDLIQSVKADGHLLYVNRVWRETLGYTEREVTFLCMQDFIHPDHLESCIRTFKQLKAGENIHNIETFFMTKEGQAIDVEGNVSGKFDDRGVLASIRGIFRDITHRKEIDRLKNEFISTVSHELRTPSDIDSWFAGASIRWGSRKIRQPDQIAYRHCL